MANAVGLPLEAGNGVDSSDTPSPEGLTPGVGPTIGTWSLEDRCALFRLLGTQHLSMMAWFGVEEYLREDEVRLVVIIDPESFQARRSRESMLLDPNADCEVWAGTMDRPRGRPISVRVGVPRHPDEHPGPYLWLELEPPPADETQGTRWVFSMHLGGVLHPPMVVEEVAGVAVIPGMAWIGGPAPEIEIVVGRERSSDGAGFVVESARAEFGRF